MLEQASFNGFLKTLFIIVMLYYLFKFAFRLFAPILINKAIKKAEQTFRHNFEQQNSYQNTAENDTTINSNTSKSKYPREKKKVGEYIDYEEVD